MTQMRGSVQAAKRRTSSVGAAISRSGARQPSISASPAVETVGSSASSAAISAARQMQWRSWAASCCSARRARASLAASSVASATIGDCGFGSAACRLSLATVSGAAAVKIDKPERRSSAAAIPAARSWGLVAELASSKREEKLDVVIAQGLSEQGCGSGLRRCWRTGGGRSPAPDQPKQDHYLRIRSGSEPAKRSAIKLSDRMVNNGLRAVDRHSPSHLHRRPAISESLVRMFPAGQGKANAHDRKTRSPLLAKRALFVWIS
jgi:hypothetical protein